MSGRTTLLYVVCSPRRCVGKTLVSRLIAEFFAIDGRPVAAFDLADEGPQLADYLPDVTTVADISDTIGQMAFFDRLIADKNGANIIDVSHRAYKNFFTVVQEIGFFEEIHRRSIEPVILFILDRDLKSGEAFASLKQGFNEASILPVRNQVAARRPGRAASDASAFPVSLEIPELSFSLRALVDQPDFSFSQYWQTPPADVPPATDDELRNWMERVFSQLWELELCIAREETLAQLAAATPPRTIRHRPPPARHAQPPGGRSRRAAEPAAPERRSIISSQEDLETDTPEEVLQYASKGKPRIEGDPMDRSGHAIVALLQKAAELTNDEWGRARSEADALSHQLQAAEDRINQLESQVEDFQDRAVRAESWLQSIQREIEETLIAPTAPTRSKSRT
jgi:hypothetical protein